MVNERFQTANKAAAVSNPNDGESGADTRYEHVGSPRQEHAGSPRHEHVGSPRHEYAESSRQEHVGSSRHECPESTRQECTESTRQECAESPKFMIQRNTAAREAVALLIQQVWEALPRKDWFAIDEPGYLAHMLSRESTLVFEACTPRGELAAVCVLVVPETDEAHLARYAGIPRSEWQQVMYVDIIATLPAYRGHSLQNCLMAQAGAYAQSQKLTRYLMATVHPQNLPSRRSMEKLGYTCVAQTTLYGGLPRCIYFKQLGSL